MGQGVRYVDILSAAQDNEFIHVETVPFEEWTLRAYGRSYGDRRDKNRRLKDGQVYNDQKGCTDMVYCFCYAPSGSELAKPRIRYPPARMQMMHTNEGALLDLKGDRKKEKIDELT